ncbi:hypothetical protein JG687_00016467 [Phytophthora cactorum]|uniref:Uncharacterized protein n=1 Tax=Phytophthora cactorum TaxID=29920 RepID=A0A329RF13_9STRA|nr:hypothetical protein Pcac1_g28628 [Phytophthora cactorum]KAG2800502.1 hypothetical protein PC112_g20449 [Phytophthora cactorum]KAG2802262.1 hypothetical protein PC111_g19187 [Phytophthora cactorum]KAG2831720.1 hypothetical protein PC113_g20880 [Phytophthora cactorum]KAG2878008.1 hypothetical protein PC114_g23339 [Phytophthora cactorum]
MDDEKAVVVAASSAVAAAIALYAAGSGSGSPGDKRRLVTVSTLRFKPMLESASYASWFEDDLRCTRKTFLQTSIFLQKHEIGFAGAKFKEHSYNNKKVAAALYFLDPAAAERWEVL